MWSRGGSAGKKPIEEVDLTLSSSPSPEPPIKRPYKPEPSRSAYVEPAHVKTEPKPTAYRPQTTPFAYKTQHKRLTTIKTEPTREPQIHPDHLAQIIHSSDPEALRTVLINLCKFSPALSGAVARGLQNSRFSQALINKYHPAPKIKTDPGKLIKTERVRARDLSDSPELLSSPKISPYIKHKRQPSAPPSNGSSSAASSNLMILDPIKRLSDGHTEQRTCIHGHKFFDHEVGSCEWHPGRVVTPTGGSSFYECCGNLVSKPGCQKSNNHVVAQSPKPSVKAEPSSVSASTNRNLQPAEMQHVNVKAESRPRTMVCRRCGQMFEDSNADDGCSFHCGEKRMTDDRIVKWTCCGSGLRGPGCQFDEFHTASYARDVPRKRTPSYEQPSFAIRTPKNPRLF
jgi:hypothetical protein